MNILIIGSSNKIGQRLVTACLNSSNISSVTSIDKNSIPLFHSKLTQIIFIKTEQVINAINTIKDVDVCIYNLSYLNERKGHDEEILHRTTSIIKKLNTAFPSLVLIYFSCFGADRTESSSVSIMCNAGIAENAILQCSLESIYFIRPRVIKKKSNIIEQVLKIAISLRLFKETLKFKSFATPFISSKGIATAILYIISRRYNI